MLKCLLSLSVVLAGVSLTAHPSLAAPVTAGADQSVSTTITSRKMTVKNHDSQAIFEGAVVLTRGTLVVYSDRMIVSFGSAQSNGVEDRKAQDTVQRKGPDTVSNRAVNKIEAIGRVKIERDSGNATCEKAVYYREEDKIVLTGSPVAWEKGTRVSGRQITMFLAEDRSVVEGGSHVRIESEGGAK
ncbi:MAG: LptA/OstA family protein [Nitrospira sp.]|nr:LptA/OstA family protein [Nitrospira sp.]